MRVGVIEVRLVTEGWSILAKVCLPSSAINHSLVAPSSGLVFLSAMVPTHPIVSDAYSCLREVSAPQEGTWQPLCYLRKNVLPILL
jgi:hypothetical protein